MVGISNVRKIDQADTKLYENMTVPIGGLVNLTESFQMMRVNLREIILASNNAEAQKYIEKAKSCDEDIVKECDIFEKTILSKEIKEAFQDSKTPRIILIQ